MGQWTALALKSLKSYPGWVETDQQVRSRLQCFYTVQLTVTAWEER
jgi:hypothetical protein